MLAIAHFSLLLGLVIFAALALTAWLNTAFCPTPLDEATRLETGSIQTATFAGTPLDLIAAPTNAGVGQPMAAAVSITSVYRISGDETYTFQLMDSPDSSTWTAIGPKVESHIVGKLAVPGFRSQRYVALSVTIAGTSPTVTYDAWLTTQGFART